jgi:hypothetical protein
MKAKTTKTPWHLTPSADVAYRECRAQAQAAANRTGYDHGLEANDLFKTFRFFMLPRKENRCGHELRCEVVHPEGSAQPGHGP